MLADQRLAPRLLKAGLWRYEDIISFEHKQSPVNNHAKGHDEEKSAWLRNGNILVDKFMKQRADNQESKQNKGKAFGALYVNFSIPLFKLSAAN